MKTKTPKKKPVKTPKIPPPPPGWEIVGKDDPRLKNLPFRPMAFDPDFPRRGWSKSGYDVGDCIASSFRKTLHYALPIVTQSATPQPAPASPPMIRLRLPSEKPTREDADKNENVFLIYREASFGGIDAIKWHWRDSFTGSELAWFSLPDGILPSEPSREERLRAEFEEKFNSKYPDGSYKEAAWQGFLAAKEGGAE